MPSAHLGSSAAVAQGETVFTAQGVTTSHVARPGDSSGSGPVSRRWRRTLTAAAMSAVAAAVAVGAFILGSDSASPAKPPATLAQAIEEASRGRLPLGGSLSTGTTVAPGPSTPPVSTLPNQALRTLTFHGTVLSASASRLVVRTGTGARNVALSKNTHFETITADSSGSSVLAAGQFVIVVPSKAPPGQAPASAAIVIVVPSA